MTTYRCTACGMEVEVEVIKEHDVVEVKPCEACLREAKKEGYEEGVKIGNDAAVEEAKYEEHLTYKNGYDKGRQEGEAKSSSSSYLRGFDDGIRQQRRSTLL